MISAGAAVFFGDLVENEFDVVQVPLEAAQGLVDQRAVLDHEQMGVENAGVRRANGARDFLLDIEEFLPRGDEGRLEALDLARNFLGADVAQGNFLLVLPVHDDLALGDARRHAKSLEDSFLSVLLAHRGRFNET